MATPRIKRSYSTLDPYARFALGHELLSKGEEIELGKRILKGDRKAINEMIEKNLKFVVSIAAKMEKSGIPIEDRVQEGNLGLIRAAEKFDYRRGVKFTSYAVWWIRSFIDRAGQRQCHAVDVPVRSNVSLKKARKAMEKYYVKHGRDADINTIIELTKVPESVAIAMMVKRRQTVSLDSPSSSDYDSDAVMLDTIKDHRDTAKQDEGRTIASVVVCNAFNGSDARLADVMKMRFGISPYDREYTLDDIGKKHKVTRERIRQIIELQLVVMRGRTHRKKFIENGRETVMKARERGLVKKRLGCAS